MAEGISELLLDTMVELTDTLSSEYQVADFLQTLVDRCIALELADTAGVLLESPGGGPPTLAAASSAAMLEIEDLEISLGQGPCLEAYRTGEQVLVADLEECRDRWPNVTPRIIALGMRSAAALPLQLRGDRVGALNLYRSRREAFAPHEHRLAQALANVAAMGILQQRTVLEAQRRASQLQQALESRVLIEQAKGTLAERRQLSLPEAFTLLRNHARNSQRTLRDVCQQVIDGELNL